MKPIPLPKQKNLRADCAWVLYQVLEQGRSSRDVLTKVQRRHNAKDNAWIQEMALGTLRQVPLLQSWLRTLLDRPLKGDKKAIEHLIMLGLYQLTFTRVSEHAAVAETVNAASYLGGLKLKGLVNAILRNFIRQQLASKPVDDPVIDSGMPKWLFKLIHQHYPEQATDILSNSNQPAPLWLRVNRQQVSVKVFCAALDELKIGYSCPKTHPEAVILQQRQDVTALPGFAQGWFAVQDGAAQHAARFIAPQPDERILDCCAAPGGKTGHLLELCSTVGECVALDADAERLIRVKENMARLGHKPTVLCADAAATDTWWDGQYFDRILLDAPCSATGVIRRHPDIRWLRKPADITALTELQSHILEAMWALLKPGGTLVYATCSILPAENREQVRAFLSRHSDAVLQPIVETETEVAPGWQILPGEQQMDGFYYARLVKSTG